MIPDKQGCYEGIDFRTAAVTAGPSSQQARRTPVFVRHVGLRSISQEEVLEAVGGLAALETIPIDMVVDTSLFADDVDNGNWGPSHGEVWRRARDISDVLRATANPRVIYAGGMPEVPHAVALGAYIEEHWALETYDYHDGTLAWTASERTLSLGEPAGLPLDKMTTAGPAVLRIEISYRIVDEHVREFVSEAEQVADVRIAPVGTDPRLGLVRSHADVNEVRCAVGSAIATLIERRPRLTVLHLFIAAPVSACVVTGQELRLRNHPPVQTYRHRRLPDGTSKTTEAIRLGAGGPAMKDIPLTGEQVARAESLRRELWTASIRDVEQYAERKEGAAQTTHPASVERWYDRLPWSTELQRVRPVPALPPVHRMVRRPATVDPTSFEGEGFGFIREQRLWRVNDGFSVRLADRFPDDATARALVRIFLFHEYLHEVHGITKASYREVGKFPNGLEHADYMCDLYGVLHELDLEAEADPTLRTAFDRFKVRVADLIDLVIRSFWSFEPPRPTEWMEIRRMRRYMNWYWQQCRVRMAETPFQVAAILGRQPVVELAGLATRAEGRRFLASLRRFDRDVGAEMCIVLDNERLARIKTGVNTPFEELVRAFLDRDHAGIQEMFRRVYADAEATGHVLPHEDDLL